MRALIRLLLALVLLAPAPALAGGFVCDPSCQACDGPSPADCTTCRAGDYLSAGSCSPCAVIDHCASNVSCTTASDSSCSSCDPTFYLDPSHTQCLACPSIDFCEDATPTCESETTSQCTSCADGRYLDESQPSDRCPACASITNCTSDLTCTTAINSRCTDCSSGSYLVAGGHGSADSCPPCESVPHCISAVTCTTASDSTCTSCEPGYVLVGGNSCLEGCTRTDDCSDHGAPAADGTRPNACGCVCDAGWSGPDCSVPGVVEACTPADCSLHGDATGDRPDCTCTCDPRFHGATCATFCTSIPFCTSAVTCTHAGDSQCTSCAPGTHLVEGTVDSCATDGVTLTEIPVAGNRTRLSDLPKKRQAQISSYDRGIDLMHVDPTVSGATLSIFSPTTGASFVLELPAGLWQGPLPGRRFRFTTQGNPKIKILLVNGRLLRVALRGSSGYPLGTPQGSVGMSLTIGTTRFCTLFGGTITKDNGVRFVARRAPRPGACPVDPADNRAPIAELNTYDANADAVAAAIASGGYDVGNVRTDAALQVDSDPDGDAFAVNAVLNPTLTIAGSPVVLAPVAGGVAAYTFTFFGRTATVTFASLGDVFLTGDANIFFPLLTGQTAVFAFDYTIVDTPGAVSNPAHVTFTVHGSTVGCIVGGRC